MAPPIHYRKPNLGHFQTRQIMCPAGGVISESTLTPQLTHWMADVLNYTRHPHTITAKYLVDTASGIDSLLEAPVMMSLGGGKTTRTLYAYFDLGTMPEGSRHVWHVTFFINQSEFQKYMQERGPTEWHPEYYDDQLRIRMEEEKKAEASSANTLKARAFKWQLHQDQPDLDISAGQTVIEVEMNTAHEYALKAAAMPENFYTPKDMAKDVVMLGVGKGVDMGVESDKAREGLGKAYEWTDRSTGVASGLKEERDKIRESQEAEESEDVLVQSQYGVFHKTRADAAAEQAVDVLSMIPGGGKFVKMFAGMFMEIGIANYAGKVTKIRIRAYTWYTTGCILGLTGAGTEHPKERFDQFFYNKALNRAVGMDETRRYQAQLYLLAYASTHYLLGTTDPGEKRKPEHPDYWTFPKDLAARWSPETLGLALATKFRTYDLLVN
ncbi:MAG: hypothetical protein WCA27_16530 [Candidatus Sulfotelmatobacter sp.]